MRAWLVAAPLLVPLAALAPAALAGHVKWSPDDLYCQANSEAGHRKSWLVYCTKQKPTFLGGTGTCFVNPAPQPRRA